MRTILTIDDTLLADARELSGIEEVPALVRLALQAYVQREAASQLARLGGSEPDIQAAPRRRPQRATSGVADINDRLPIRHRNP